MQPHIRSIVAGCLVTVAACGHSPRARCYAQAGQPPVAEKTALTERDRKAIAWFDTLDYLNLAGKRCVRVATGASYQSGDDPPANRYLLGFLLTEKGDQFTVFMPDLSTDTYRRTPPGTPEHRHVGYSAVDLKEVAAAQLAQLRKPPDKEDHLRRFGERLSERGEVFLMARACAANGLEPLAHELIAEAARMPARNEGEPPGDLVDALSREIAHSRMWQAVVEFGEPSISRKELLERFRFIVKHFPTSEHAARAKETADLLAQMVKEDEEHARQGTKALDKLPIKERVAELIFRLRDQNGHQWMQPGWCDIFDDLGGIKGGKTPAHQLVALGFDAVPQLIDVLDDRRFSRSVGFHRNFYFSHHVLRVGDCALAIIERIAGRSFYARRTTSSEMMKEGQESEVKKQIRTWWSEVQTKGEKQVLIEAVGVGDRNSVYQAEQLLKKYPQDALGPIVAAAKKHFDGSLRAELVGLVCKVPGEASTQFLLEEMEKSPYGQSRVAAAQGLLQRGRSEAIPAMIGLWETVSARSPDAEKKGRVRPGELPSYEGTEEVVGFLAQCGDPAAIDALAKHMRRHGIDRRIAIVSAFGTSGSFGVISSGGGGGLRPGRAGASQKGEVEKAIERLLVAALDDTEQREGMSGSWGDKSFQDPRVCDLAAHTLAERLPKKYDFDLSAALGERDRQRLLMVNVWRKGQNLPAIPLPKPKRIAPVTAATTDPLLAKLVEARSAEQRKQAIAELQRLGLPALPAVRQRLASLDPKHSARTELEPLAASIASIVSEVTFTEQSASPPDSLRRLLEDAKGKPLTGKGFVGVLLAAAKDLPAGSTGVRLWAIRNGDDTGVTLRVELTKGPAGGEVWINGGGWATSEAVTVGRKSIHGSSGGSSSDHGLTAEGHRDLVRSVDEAVAATPDKAFMVRASMVKMP
ncbi:MAG: hypothetical protein ABSG86_27390 [Thermoguttaceae bacterium]|jgi:hypothetical protein